MLKSESFGEFFGESGFSVNQVFRKIGFFGESGFSANQVFRKIEFFFVGILEYVKRYLFIIDFQSDFFMLVF